MSGRPEIGNCGMETHTELAYKITSGSNLQLQRKLLYNFLFQMDGKQKGSWGIKTFVENASIYTKWTNLVLWNGVLRSEVITRCMVELSLGIKKHLSNSNCDISPVFNGSWHRNKNKPICGSWNKKEEMFIY